MQVNRPAISETFLGQFTIKSKYYSGDEKMKKRISIVALAGMVFAAPAVAQDTTGEDFIGSVMGILALGNSNSLGSEAVEKSFELGYSEVEVNSWDMTDASGADFSGAGGMGERLRLGYRVVGANRDGLMATYGFGLEHATVGDDMTSFEARYVGAYGDAGIGYVTDFGVDFSALAIAGFGVGETRFLTTEVKGAPTSLGFGLGIGYSYDNFRAQLTVQRRFLSSGLTGRISSSEVTDEFSFDTTEIGGSIAFSF